ncbi:MAG: hypothetical protein GKR89_26000 [Candidatus Latescibacteria bacterium]|nr:hypothetical protein [Candidatus Latescibacterota bacterium]
MPTRKYFVQGPQLWIIAVLLLLGLCPSLKAQAGGDSSSGLARLAFLVPPERMDEFAQVYRDQILPSLKPYRLEPAASQGRATADSIFSRLFVADTPGQIVEINERARRDTTLRRLLRQLGERFGTVGDDGGIKAEFTIYETPAGQGRRVAAGPGVGAPLGPGQGHWRTYDVTDGLAGPIVRSLLQDSQGRIWCGTQNNGASRFDGQQWRHFSVADGLGHSQVMGIFQDRSEALWFATFGGGASRFDNGTWTALTQSDGLADNRVLSVQEDEDGHFWFCTAGGVSRFDGGAWTSLTRADGLIDNRVVSMLRDASGTQWFATLSGLSRYDGVGWTTVELAAGAGEEVFSLLEDSWGYRWVGGRGGLSRFDGDSWTTFTRADGLGHEAVTALLEDRRGVLWAGTPGGVSRYDGQSWQTLSVADGLAYPQIYSILEDSDGVLWFGTGGGVSRYDAHSFAVFTAADGLADGFKAIMADGDGALWFANGNPSLGEGAGFSRYAEGEWRIFTAADGFDLGGVTNLYKGRNGDLWLATTTGVSRYDGEQVTHFTPADGLLDAEVFAVLEDSHGRMWFGTEEGVSRYDGTQFISLTRADGLAPGPVITMLEDRHGHIWFGTADGGIARYDGAQFSRFTQADGLGHDQVFDILEASDGTLWFATHGGVSAYDGESFRTFTTADGLAANDVHAVLQAEDGTFWFGTDGGGVSHFDGRVFQTLTRADGLASNIALALAQDGDGALWISSPDGVTRHRPLPPGDCPVRINAVVADRRYPAPSEVEVTTRTELLAVEFSGVSLRTRPGQLVYLYRLLGRDEEWRQTRTGQVEYADLPVGEYVFEVVAVDRDLNYSAAPAQVQIEVLPPYERLAWILALLAALGLIIWQGRRVVVRGQQLALQNAELQDTLDQLEATQQELVLREKMVTLGQVVAGLTHEINTPLGAVQSARDTMVRAADRLVRLLGGAAPEGERQAQRPLAVLAQAGGAMGRATERMVAIIDNLRTFARLDEAEFQVADLHEGLESALALLQTQMAQGVKVTRNFAELEPIYCSPGQLNQVFMHVLKNALEAIEGEGEIRIRTFRQDDQLCVQISDTGVGIPPAQLEKIFDFGFRRDADRVRMGVGLSADYRIVRAHQGDIQIDSQVGQGTEVTIRLPLRQSSAA